MKLAVLYTRISGYLAACLTEYRKHTDAELLLFAKPAQANAPFDLKMFSDLGEMVDRMIGDQNKIEERIHAFRPDAVLVSGWIDPAYNRICQRLKTAGIPTIAGCDTQWKGSLRQHAASLIAPWHVRRFIDVLWVTGERQRYLANALGFRGTRCWDGFYACDWESFSKPAPAPTRVPHFVFVGRYVEEKGIRDLAQAYKIYRKQVANPWPLICAGKGELARVLTEAGAQNRGFIQPNELPALMHQASVFVLPSRFEPWGVVIQEAAASRLPLIVSEACGAGVHLVQDRFNGFVTETGNAPHLAQAFLHMHRMDETERLQFGRRSFELSKQYTPERWAKTLSEGLNALSAERNV